jgi:hypothetical protein
LGAWQHEEDDDRWAGMAWAGVCCEKEEKGPGSAFEIGKRRNGLAKAAGLHWAAARKKKNGSALGSRPKARFSIFKSIYISWFGSNLKIDSNSNKN